MYHMRLELLVFDRSPLRRAHQAARLEVETEELRSVTLQQYTAQYTNYYISYIISIEWEKFCKKKMSTKILFSRLKFRQTEHH